MTGTPTTASASTRASTLGDPPAATEPTTPAGELAWAAVAEDTTATTPIPESTGSPLDDQPAPCDRLTDFDSEESNRRWLVVNDDVMGGQSLGGLAFDDGMLTFDGAVDTDGGGFASLRFPLEPGQLAGSDRIVFRARPDDRSYM